MNFIANFLNLELVCKRPQSERVEVTNLIVSEADSILHILHYLHSCSGN